MTNSFQEPLRSDAYSLKEEDFEPIFHDKIDSPVEED